MTYRKMKATKPQNQRGCKCPPSSLVKRKTVSTASTSSIQVGVNADMFPSLEDEVPVNTGELSTASTSSAQFHFGTGTHSRNHGIHRDAFIAAVTSLSAVVVVFVPLLLCFLFKRKSANHVGKRGSYKVRSIVNQTNLYENTNSYTEESAAAVYGNRDEILSKENKEKLGLHLQDMGTQTPVDVSIYSDECALTERARYHQRSTNKFSTVGDVEILSLKRKDLINTDYDYAFTYRHRQKTWDSSSSSSADEQPTRLHRCSDVQWSYSSKSGKRKKRKSTYNSAYRLYSLRKRLSSPKKSQEFCHHNCVYSSRPKKESALRMKSDISDYYIDPHLLNPRIGSLKRLQTIKHDNVTWDEGAPSMSHATDEVSYPTEDPCDSSDSESDIKEELTPEFLLYIERLKSYPRRLSKKTRLCVHTNTEANLRSDAYSIPQQNSKPNGRLDPNSKLQRTKSKPNPRICLLLDRKRTNRLSKSKSADLADNGRVCLNEDYINVYAGRPVTTDYITLIDDSLV